MKRASMVLLVVALLLALLFGGNSISWGWTPALAVLGAAVLASAGDRRSRGRLLDWLPLLLASSWILYRCAISPVQELARADALLVLALMATAWLVAGIERGGAALRCLYDGLVLAVVANAIVAFFQWQDPEFSWPYDSRPTESLSGLFSHYNYFSNFLVGAAGLLAGRLIFGQDAWWRKALQAFAVLLVLALVPLSGSRGGTLALCFVGLLLMICAVAVLFRRRSRWFGLAAASFPVVLVIGGGLGWAVLNGIQSQRKSSEGLISLVDGSDRLGWIELGLATSKDHFLVGGGSRSYSWERNAKWDQAEFGWNRENEPFVHNEALQAITDYGIVGLALIVGALGLLVWRCVEGLVVGTAERDKNREDDAVLAGVLSACGAIVLQSNLSYVFHMLPSVLLLGLCLGLTVPRRESEIRAFWRAWPVGVLLAAPLMWFGIRGSVALKSLWPVLYDTRGSEQLSREQMSERYETARKYWPGYRVAELEGHFYLGLAGKAEGLVADEWRDRAIESYRAAAKEHPYNAVVSVNLGNALSTSGRYDEATREFERTIKLQGKLEAMCKGRFYMAQNIHREWYGRWTKERRASEALHEFLRAQRLLEEAKEFVMPGIWWRDCLEFEKDLDQSIEFLEGAGITPQAPEPR
ncbi:O-antigen ligase family protein [Haloferula chungangensis]|uniref:O-antigen ligase family protein n=1 Tax=Haloferula chungangensis TaxID=1048331 RepID=A0ABW2L9R5_9BACT